MSKMAEDNYKLLEPDIRRRASLFNLRYHFAVIAVICLVAALCALVSIFILFQICLNINLMENPRDMKLRLRPPISHYLQSPSPHGNVQVASGALKTSWPDPPPHDQVAKVARYIVHISDWASIATVSVAPVTAGFPFVNILSLSDGPIEQSSGVPYMYLTPRDLSSHDLEKDSRASLSMTEAQSDYCQKNNYDPESPLCARILMTGNIVKVEEGSDEEAFARSAMFSRHPAMELWPKDHRWFFAKMNITHMYVLDYYGGFRDIDIEEYFDADPF